MLIKLGLLPSFFVFKNGIKKKEKRKKVYKNYEVLQTLTK